MPAITFKTFFFASTPEAPQSPAFRESFLNLLVSTSNAARWWRDPGTGLRYTISKTSRIGEALAVGMIAQEHLLERHIYTDDKVEAVNSEDSYADRLFVIDFNRMTVTLEWRRFYRQQPLTLPITATRLQTVLTNVLTEALSPGAEAFLLDIALETTKEEFIGLFYANRTLYLEADSIGMFPVGSSIQLVNPNEHLEGAARDILAHDFELRGLHRLQAEVAQDSDGDLRRSVVARGALHSGAPRSLQYQSPSGSVRTRKEHEKGMMRMDLPSDFEATPETRAIAAQQVVDAANGLDLGPRRLPPQQPLDNLELFDDE
jgi:hypothetical protein